MTSTEFSTCLNSGFVSRAKDTLEAIVSMGAKTVKIGATFALGGWMAVAPLLYAADRDKDGLPDNVETNTGVYVSPTNTGTNPDDPDTDKDMYNDGIEVTNIAFGGGPFDPLLPQNTQFYSLDNPEPILIDLSHHQLMPVLSNDGTKIAYIRTDDYTNGTICMTTMAEPRSETVLCEINGTFDLNQVTFSPNDDKVIYADTQNNRTNLYGVDITTGASTPLTALAEGKHIRDPYVVSYPASTGLGDWVYCATENVTGDGVSEITAFPLLGDGSIDLGGYFSIIDIQSGSVGKERWQKLNADGRYMICSVQLEGNANTQTRIFKVEGLESILSGETSKVTSMSDARFTQAGAPGWNQPIGLSPTGRVMFYSEDINGIFDKGSYNFEAADFDIFVARITDAGGILHKRVPFEGDEFSGVNSSDGTRLIYSTNNNFTATTPHQIFSAYITSINTPDEGGGIEHPFTIEDPSGVRLFLPKGSSYTLEENPSSSNTHTITIRSLTYDAKIDLANHKIYVPREFGPSGMTFQPPEEGEVTPLLTFRYLDEEIQGGTEELFQLFEYNNNTDQFDIPLEVLSRDTGSNTINAKITGFCTIAIKPERRTEAGHWNLYE